MSQARRTARPRPAAPPPGAASGGAAVARTERKRTHHPVEPPARGGPRHRVPAELPHQLAARPVHRRARSAPGSPRSTCSSRCSRTVILFTHAAYSFYVFGFPSPRAQPAHPQRVRRLLRAARVHAVADRGGHGADRTAAGVDVLRAHRHPRRRRLDPARASAAATPTTTCARTSGRCSPPTPRCCTRSPSAAPRSRSSAGTPALEARRSVDLAGQRAGALRRRPDGAARAGRRAARQQRRGQDHDAARRSPAWSGRPTARSCSTATTSPR